MSATALASPSLSRSSATGSGTTRAAWALAGLSLVAFGIFEVTKHHLGPWPILIFIVLPDLSFLAGIGGKAAKGQLPRRAVPVYNAVHRPIVPLTVTAAAAFGLLSPFWFVAGLSWLAHIAIDRASGYRLRAPDGWQRG